MPQIGPVSLHDMFKPSGPVGFVSIGPASTEYKRGTEDKRGEQGRGICERREQRVSRLEDDGGEGAGREERAG